MAEGKRNIEDAIERLIQEGFIEEDRATRADHLIFSSLVLRDVLYSALTRRKRRALHSKYAEYLETKNAGRLERVYPQLVHHYSHADHSTKAVEYGLKQAVKSLEAFSPEEAIRAARIVLDFLEDVSDLSLEVEARMLLGKAYRMSGNIDASLKEWEAAIKLFENRKEMGKVVTLLLLIAETSWEARKVATPACTSDSRRSSCAPHSRPTGSRRQRSYPSRTIGT